MKLYAIIDGKEYGITNDGLVAGATFSEEYNETLDSGTIILSQIDLISELEPFDDVYIYDDVPEGESHKFYKHMLVDDFSEELNNVRYSNYKYKINLFSETKRLEKIICPNLSITQPVDKNIRRSIWDYLKCYVDLYSPKIKIATGENTWSYVNKYELSNNANIVLPAGYKQCEYIESSGVQWIDTGVVFNSNNINGKIELEINNPINNTWFFGSVNQQYLGVEGGIYNDSLYTDRGFSYSQKHSLNFRTVANFSTSGAVITNLNFYLFARNHNNDTQLNDLSNCKIFRCKMYNNKILIRDFIPCLNDQNVPGLYDLVNGQFYTNNGTGTFGYKLSVFSKTGSISVKEKFSDVDAPEISLTNPTLRDVLTQLMLVKDCIPVVHDDVIDFLDVSQRNGDFEVEKKLDNEECINYIHSSMNSEDYSTEARREYSQALSQENTAKMVEYLGFRNSNTALLKIEDMVLETRFPIYKVNKLYMCYYKEATIFNEQTEQFDKNIFLCKQDITNLVCQNVVRNSLSQDYLEFDRISQNILKTEELSKFKVCTIGYDIGSNQITGWNEKYDFYQDNGWYKKAQTILQNIICFMDLRYPFGIKGSFAAKQRIESETIETGTEGLKSIITGGMYGSDGGTGLDNLSIKQKAVFFQIDYDAMFSGALVHSKDFKNNDDLMTVDNCSSSLTVTEVDGLFEKEKLNRLGNRQYNIQARYEGSSAFELMNNKPNDSVPGRNHILGSVYSQYDKDGNKIIDDVIIYHKEYQIYEDFILANYAGTFDYVLKNYFTSVFAKLRTYNLASYGESIVRAENYKEYVILSEDGATYEDGTLLYPHLEKYLSCFDLTEVPEIINNEAHNRQINFAYIDSKTKAFSDVNSFCSGYSLCVDLKMYDNVTHGVYIKNAQSPTDATGSIEEWSLAVNNVEDAFQKNISFGFGHLYQEGDILKENKSILIPEKGSTNINVYNIYDNNLLKFPNFYTNDILNNNTDYSVSLEKNIFKDNKEIIDYTFQFETITNDSKIFFSQYFIKLNDMSGNYKKWEKSGVIKNETLRNIKNSKVKWYSKNSGARVGCQIGFPSGSLEDDEYIISEGVQSPDIGGHAFNVYYNIRWTLLGITSFNSQEKKLYCLMHHYDAENGRVVYDENTEVIFNFEKTENGFDYYNVDFVPISTQSSYSYEYIRTFIGQGVRFFDDMPYTKNMFAIVSEKEIEKQIIYDNYMSEFCLDDFVIEKNKQYNLIDVNNAGEDVSFNVNFTSNNVNFKGITFNLSSMWYINQNDSLILACTFEQGQPIDWANDNYANIILTGGEDFEKLEFINWIKSSIAWNKQQKVKSGITILNLPDYMHIVNTDDELNEYTNDTYIPFSNMFSFDKTDIPTIHVGNEFLSEYPNHKSIQFWYLDNNGEGAGKLQFVFGVNTEENTKDIYASVATRRAPFVFSQDHKKIIGTIKQMTPDDYTQENLFDYYEEEE